MNNIICTCATPHQYTHIVSYKEIHSVSQILLISAEKSCVSWTNKDIDKSK